MKVLLEVNETSPGYFDIQSPDGMLMVNSWYAPNYQPEETGGGTGSKVGDALKLKQQGFSDEAVIELLKG